MAGVWPITRRILLAIRGDRRTLGLVLFVPVFLIYLVSEVFADPQEVAAPILAVLVFILTYLLTAIGFLRERQAGTLERVLVAPVSRTSIVVGYFSGYGLLATVQVTVLLGAAIVFLEIDFAHGIGLFFVLEMLGAVTAIGVGILLSLFAENEFQAVQFIPLVISPQVILGDVFVPVEELPVYLEIPARAMPITYLVDGMDYVILGSGHRSDLWIAIFVLLEFTVLAVGIAQFVVKQSS
ncbi:MAG: ABC transporter permease [Halobacteriales archaeon]|nr:ABC transporter permease [Halobacteriales archaeon]